MAASPEGEFNPWPAFVDIFSSVILCLLTFFNGCIGKFRILLSI